MDWWWKRVAALLTDITHNVWWVSHAGLTYVDDGWWIRLQSFGILQASLALLIFVSMGVPLGWKRCSWTPKVPWSGLALDIAPPCLALTPVQDQQDPDSRFYTRAVKLVELGATLEEIMRECELPRAEAELLLNFHKK